MGKTKNNPTDTNKIQRLLKKLEKINKKVKKIQDKENDAKPSDLDKEASMEESEEMDTFDSDSKENPPSEDDADPSLHSKMEILDEEWLNIVGNNKHTLSDNKELVFTI